VRRDDRLHRGIDQSDGEVSEADEDPDGDNGACACGPGLGAGETEACRADLLGKSGRQGI
jgi:hypothetical protein